MNLSSNWNDYEILASGDGEKVERFGNIVLRRPDPQIIWKKDNNNPLWNKCDGTYIRSSEGGGYWKFNKKLPEYWTINYKDLTFKISPTNFKHTGIFPEQATNWDFIINKLKENKTSDFKVLNLFAYTGCATMVASLYGASSVVHVDSSKGINEWAKENMKLCKCENNEIHFIQDDALKFIKREQNRGKKYNAIIMDPPSYGRGPNKEVWKLENNLPELLENVKLILDDDYSFVLISCYTTGFSPISLYNLIKLTFPTSNVECGELGLPIKENNLILPCGIYARITKN